MSTAERADDDAALLVAAATDGAAFETFYRRYVRRVTGFASGRCSCAEDVADVVAETFVRLLHRADRYDSTRAEPAAFVLGIAANVVRDLHRRRSRHEALVWKLSGRQMLDRDDIERAEAALDAVRSAGLVEAAVSSVPVHEQEMLRLVAAGRTATEAAHELGISPAAAWTRLSRARHRLRIQMTSTPKDGDQS
ncbi:MAG TPA: sigma-70 family RNA polymerase sigma factor [Acidimicrobiales bacterium]|jgi:RNA polymerase sigma-70 factor (ECF subfamily)